jgi:serine/threonine protein kinase
MYKKGDRLDSGAFGTVFSGLDMETGELLAIKTVKLSTNLEKVT